MPHAVLHCHPSSPSAAITQIEVNVTAVARVLRLKYRLVGDIDRIVVPSPRPEQRQEGLWRHTCAEMFVCTLGTSGYHEFNYSPSGEWAAYWFDDFRQGMVAAEVSPPLIIATRSDGELHIDVQLDLRSSIAFTDRSRCAFSCVVEETDGRISFWALQHAPGDKPDFHHSSGFIFEPFKLTSSNNQSKRSTRNQ